MQHRPAGGKDPPIFSLQLTHNTSPASRNIVEQALTLTNSTQTTFARCLRTSTMAILSTTPTLALTLLFFLLNLVVEQASPSTVKGYHSQINLEQQEEADYYYYEQEKEEVVGVTADTNNVVTRKGHGSRRRKLNTNVKAKQSFVTSSTRGGVAANYYSAYGGKGKKKLKLSGASKKDQCSVGKGKGKGQGGFFNPKQTCLNSGFELTGADFPVDGREYGCEMENAAACNSDFGTITSDEAARDAFCCLEEAGAADYPLYLANGENNVNPADEELRWGFRQQAGALNGEAFCATHLLDPTNPPANDNDTRLRIASSDPDLQQSDVDISEFAFDYYVESCPDSTMSGEPCGDEFFLVIYMSDPTVDRTTAGRFADCGYRYFADVNAGYEGNWYTFVPDLTMAPTSINPDVYPGGCPDTLPEAFMNPDLKLGNRNCQQWAITMGSKGSDETGLSACFDNIRPTYDGAQTTFDLQMSNAVM